MHRSPTHAGALHVCDGACSGLPQDDAFLSEEFYKTLHVPEQPADPKVVRVSGRHTTSSTSVLVCCPRLVLGRAGVRWRPLASVGVCWCVWCAGANRVCTRAQRLIEQRPCPRLLPFGSFPAAAAGIACHMRPSRHGRRPRVDLTTSLSATFTASCPCVPKRWRWSGSRTPANRPS